MANRPSLDDYVDVAERIAHFKDEYPDGTLQTLHWSVEEVGGKTFIVYRAAAYRTPDDARPGHGTAWEPFPGPTPYTRDSELMNAETAAWGRAIIAVGIASKKVASRQEVQARRGPQRDAQGRHPSDPAWQQPASPESRMRERVEGPELVTPKDVAELQDAAKGLRPSQIKTALQTVGATVPSQLTKATAFKQVPKAKAADLARLLSTMPRDTYPAEKVTANLS